MTLRGRPRYEERSEGVAIGGFLYWNFRLFRIFDIQVRAHWLLPVIIVVYILQGLLGEWGFISMVWFAALMAALFICILVHEFGHCFAARAVGGHAEEIILWPLGGLSYVGHGGAPRDDIKVAAAGPLTHIPIVALCLAILLLLGNPWDWQWLNVFSSWYPFRPFEEFFWHNLLVAIVKLQIILFFFNLLVPAYPLDGGRILVNFLLMRYGRDRAAVISTMFSIPIGIVIVIWGFLRGDVFFAFIGVWVLYEAWQIRRLARMGEISAHPMFGMAPEFDFMPEPQKRPGLFARWRAKRTRNRMQLEAERLNRLQARVDEILAKVSQEGIQSLTPAERRILEDASKRG